MFDEGPLLKHLEERTGLAINWVANVSDRWLLARSEDELVEEVVDRFDVQPPRLLVERKEVSAPSSHRRLELHIPVEGDIALFRWEPRTPSGRQIPVGQVLNEGVVIALGYAHELRDDAERVVQARIDDLQYWVEWVEHEVGVWRRPFRDEVRRALRSRIEEVKAQQAVVANLGIPIRPRDDAPRVFKDPAVIKRRASPGRGPAPSEEGPWLAEDYYEHILYVIRAAGKAMERSPRTYENWREEDRRQVLILMLNTHYEGEVHAEAFNNTGHTDILIRSEDKNVFIGECKFYDGRSSVTAAIDQIFGYATYRDVKLALILFVNRKGFKDAVQKAKDAVAGHEQWRDWVPVKDAEEGEFRARMAFPGEEQHLVTLHVSAFHTLPPEHSAR